MAAEGMLVFDDEPSVSLVEGETGRTSVIVEPDSDVLVFDPEPTVRGIADSDDDTDFLLFDAAAPHTEVVQLPQDFLLIDSPPEPAVVVLDTERHEDVLVITPGGPPGPRGPQGAPGVPGAPGASGPGYYQTFGFAQPVSTWVLAHGQDTFGLVVETVDQNGDPLEGYVRYVDSNVIEVDWYYATAGEARLFR